MIEVFKILEWFYKVSSIIEVVCLFVRTLLIVIHGIHYISSTGEFSFSNRVKMGSPEKNLGLS